MLDQTVIMDKSVVSFHTPRLSSSGSWKRASWPYQGQGAGQQEQEDDLGLFRLQGPHLHQPHAQGYNGERQLHHGCPGQVLEGFLAEEASDGSCGLVVPLGQRLSAHCPHGD